MKILTVRFLNLNSLKGEHEIRFDQSPLADAGLFAITGPTGAGKTTILDAITVGLYGQAHRHNNDRPLELMTRHTAECFSEVTFEANGKVYRSKWNLRRSRGKVDGRIQGVHMELYDAQKNELFDLNPSKVPAKVAELCGLDYDQFLRSVMLSQGDFARFLKANEGERSSLLEKITDTGIYSDISKAAFEKAKAERLRLEDLEKQLNNMQPLSGEQREAYQLHINELTEKETQLQTNLTTLQEKMQWLQQLTQLENRQSRHEQAVQAQEQQLTTLQPDFIRLEQHQQAYQFTNELAEIRNADSRATEAQELLHTLQKRVPRLATELEAAGKMAIEVTKVYEQQQAALQQLTPLLSQVTRLDEQLSSIRAAYNTNKIAYQDFARQLQQEKAVLQARQQEKDTLKLEAIGIKDWLDQNATLQDLREHLPEFRTTLRNLQAVEQRIQRIQKEQRELQQQQSHEARQIAELKQQLATLDTQQEQLQSQKNDTLKALQALLAGKSLPHLQEEAQKQPALLARYQRLKELSGQHARQQQKLQGIATQQLQLQEQHKQATTQLLQSQTNLAQAEEHLQALQKIVALQQQVQQYEKARHTLTQDEPCPLCGSTHHPFAAGGYTFDLPEEVRKRDAQQALVKELERSIQQGTLHLSGMEQQTALNHRSQNETEQELSTLHQTFGQVAGSLPHKAGIADLAELTQLHAIMQTTASALEQQVSQALACNLDLDNLKQQLQQLHAQQLQAQANHNQLQVSDKHVQAQLQRLHSNLTDEQTQHQDHTEMAESFAATYGLRYTPETRTTLLTTLEQQAVVYTQKQQALEAMREKYITLQEQVKNLEANEVSRQKELDAKKQALTKEHEQLTTLKQERHTLFGDKDPEQERERATQELHARARQAEEARSAQLQKQQELQEARTRHTECQQQHQQSASVLEGLRKGLLSVLQQKGIETIEALSQMLLQRDEADRLANQKAQAEKHLTELRKSLSDVRHELAKLRGKELTNEELTQLQAQFQEQTEKQRELISQRARQEQLLEQDDKLRTQNAALAQQLHTQQQVCHRWAQLAELIGSSDGSRFSRFAQGLTLARLVELANRHLNKLNDRYRIHKSDDEDLNLLIADTYQAEAVRPMNTLSGGESFLVSLALALGLSDLAGRRTQINSLFIDEGFGTLDAETLDAAITTLDNLRNAGKTIGVISHVEALKERIQTQIVVSKKAGGISKVQVIGN